MLWARSWHGLRRPARPPALGHRRRLRDTGPGARGRAVAGFARLHRARAQSPRHRRAAERRPGAVRGAPGGAGALLAREGVALALHANAENRLDEAFLARAALPATRRGIGASARWVLVEAPFQAHLPSLPDLVFRL